MPILLAVLGLRRSEICALTVDDIEGNVCTINKAKVQNEQKEWIIKSTKTTGSTRTVLLPDHLCELIRNQGTVFDGAPNMIYKELIRVEKLLGLPHFSLHKLRHFFASYMHEL